MNIGKELAVDVSYAHEFRLGSDERILAGIAHLLPFRVVYLSSCTLRTPGRCCGVLSSFGFLRFLVLLVLVHFLKGIVQFVQTLVEFSQYLGVTRWCNSEAQTKQQ